ncbi:outer membrane immunogenic protein [Mesorhizobium australicum]|uniref:Outer membrane immunogenic protein n=1 Tax=Mesorhizobium australicum TaxID=536018 RepID=A0A1X7N7D0_9HYPH|nr:outer membrane immunogenic protein [Mesorhizobium australicum]
MKRCVTAILLLAATPAVAADEIPAPIAERFAGDQNFDWSGFRLGVQGGYAWGSPGVVAGDGAIGGIHGGYDWTLGDAVAGVEGSVSAADIEIGPDNRLTSVIDLRARLGYSFDRVLVYGTAGGAYGSTSAGVDGRGLAVGAGLDFATLQNAIFGLQYLKYKFEDLNNTGNSLEIDLIEGKLTYKF